MSSGVFFSVRFSECFVADEKRMQQSDQRDMRCRLTPSWERMVLGNQLYPSAWWAIQITKSSRAQVSCCEAQVRDYSSLKLFVRHISKHGTGAATYKGEDLLSLEPEERAKKGIFMR